MALDTAAKRAAVAHLKRPGTGVTPDATMPGVWRAAVAGSYGGDAFPAGAAEASPTITVAILRAPSMSRLRLNFPTTKHFAQQLSTRTRSRALQMDSVMATTIGASGTFTTVDGKTVTVTNGIITGIA